MLDKNRADNYKYVVEKLISETMDKDEYFNPKEYIWVLGSKVLASLALECNNVHVGINKLCGIEVHEGRDYGDEAIMLLRDVTKQGKIYFNLSRRD